MRKMATRRSKLILFPERLPPSVGSGERRGDRTPVLQRSFQVEGEGSEDEPRSSSTTSPPPTTEGLSLSQGGGALYKQQRGEGPSGSRNPVAELVLGLKGRAVLIEARLATSVHPNPGPGIRLREEGRGRGDQTRD